jgi:drug/metabolite transporter (DMT)-like permease
MILGQLAALGTAVMWSLTAVFFSYSGRRVGSQVVNRSRLLFAFIFLSFAHLILQGTLFPWDAQPFRWFWFAISSILGLVLGDTFLFQAYVLIGPRLSMLLMSTVPIYSVIFGWLLFGEQISSVELAGILLAVSGIAWVVSEKRAQQTVVENKQYRKGIIFGLAGALGQVANLVTARYGLVGGYPAISASIIRILIAMIILWLVAALTRQVRYTLEKWRDSKAFRAIVAGAFVGPFLGIWLSLIAVQNARLGIAATLMALPPILLIPIEYIAYRQRASRRAIVGTVVAILGVALIFLPG